MTRKEKFKAIVDRCKLISPLFGPQEVTCLVIVSYISSLKELGILNMVMEITPYGKKIVSICEEFGWTPSDKEIDSFVDNMTHHQDSNEIRFYLKRYRDDKEKFIENIKTHKFKNKDN